MSRGFCTRHVLSEFADCYGLYDPKNAVCACWCSMRLTCCLEVTREDNFLELDEMLDPDYLPGQV